MNHFSVTTIDHPDAARFDAFDRSMMRQIGIRVAPPESLPTNTIDTESAQGLAARRAEIARQVASMVDVPN